MPTRDLSALHCQSCGGELAPVPPRILAELALPLPATPHPPTVPRHLPADYVRRVRYFRNVHAILGAIFQFFGGLAVVSALLEALGAHMGGNNVGVGILGGAVHYAIGVWIWRIGRRRAENRLAALVHGHAVEGTISEVTIDTSQSVNERHPTLIHFRYESPAGQRTGSVISWDPLSRRRQAGERVWVTSDPADPECSTLWPPLW